MVDPTLAVDSWLRSELRRTFQRCLPVDRMQANGDDGAQNDSPVNVGLVIPHSLVAWSSSLSVSSNHVAKSAPRFSSRLPLIRCKICPVCCREPFLKPYGIFQAHIPNTTFQVPRCTPSSVALRSSPPSGLWWILSSRATGPMAPAWGPVRAIGSIAIQTKTVSAAPKKTFVWRVVSVSDHSSIWYVRCTLLLLLDNHSRHAICGIDVDLEMKVYRGACTVKDWSNTTACSNQWCNDGKQCLYSQHWSFLLIVHNSFIYVYSCLLWFLFPVTNHTWSKLWLCPSLNNGPVQWWCGNESETTPCRNGVDAYFLNFTKGAVLGFPPITSSSSAGTKIFSDIVTTTFSAEPTSNPASVLASSPSKTSTDPSMPTQTQGHSASLPTAVGVGIGVPLGIACLGFLGFLFWKQVGRQRSCTSQSRVLREGPTLAIGDQPATAAIREQWSELPGIQSPRELGGTSRKEVPSSWHRR